MKKDNKTSKAVCSILTISPRSQMCLVRLYCLQARSKITSTPSRHRRFVIDTPIDSEKETVHAICSKPERNVDKNIFSLKSAENDSIQHGAGKIFLYKKEQYILIRRHVKKTFACK